MDYAQSYPVPFCRWQVDQNFRISVSLLLASCSPLFQNVLHVAADPQACHCPGVVHPQPQSLRGVCTPGCPWLMDRSASGLSLLWQEVPPSKSAVLSVFSVMSSFSWILHVSFVSLFCLSSQQLLFLNMFEEQHQVLLGLTAHLADDGFLGPFQSSSLFLPHRSPSSTLPPRPYQVWSQDSHMNVLFLNTVHLQILKLKEIIRIVFLTSLAHFAMPFLRN